jgi:hypothetical protein
MEVNVRVEFSQDTLLTLLDPLWDSLDRETKRMLRSTSTQLRGFVNDRITHLDCGGYIKGETLIRLCEGFHGLQSIQLQEHRSGDMGAVQALFDRDDAAPACCPRLTRMDLRLVSLAAKSGIP